MIETYFSIIMLVYNTKEEYLRYAVSSVLNQIYRNFEFIIIDDGSNKETKKILKEYEKSCIIHHQENKGMPQSRLEGLKMAKGDYVIFIDSDDYLNPNTLNLYNEIINKYNVDIVLANFVKFKNNISNIIGNVHYLKEGPIDKKDVLKQLCLLHLSGTCGRATKRNLFQGMENYIDTRFAVGEDVQQSSYVFTKANSFYYTEEKIYYYRIVEEHRPYNNIKNLCDSDFLVPVYKILFENQQNEEFLCTFKNSALNSVIYNGFRICLWLKGKEKIKYLDLLNNLETVHMAKRINKKTSLVTYLLFYMLNNRLYFLFNIMANIYDLIYGMQRI